MTVFAKIRSHSAIIRPDERGADAPQAAERAVPMRSRLLRPGTVSTKITATMQL
jgi:hypothetical protein